MIQLKVAPASWRSRLPVLDHQTANLPLETMQSSSIRIIDTKLQPPALIETHVLRTALVDRIATASVKLVLVHAPAGFGKTTAMAQALSRIEERGFACAWITLDAADNDISRFVSALTEAGIRLGVEEPSGKGPLEAVAAFAGINSPFALFLDEFEVLQAPGVLGLLREIVEQLPRHGKVVIGSRRLPDIGIGRLRTRGELLEIDTDVLRFDMEDTRAYFGRRGHRTLGIDSLSKLHRRTEGWVAALWLASMALERGGSEVEFVDHFSGSALAVADYLAEDVLSQQPKEVRDFLLRTSVLRHLDVSSCQTLCPRLDCAAILDQLQASNLFITPVSHGRKVWRYHSLFAEFLRAQLELVEPNLPPRLHLMASGWYESQGRPVPAIDHAIEGGDFPLALDLLEAHAERFLEQGRMRLLSQWFSAIPTQLLREHPLLQVIGAWASCFTQGPWVAMQQLEESGCFNSPLPSIQAEARTLHPLLLAMQDRYDEAYEAGTLALTQSPAPRMAFAQGTLLNIVASVSSVRGDTRESRRLIESARQNQGDRNNFNRMYSESLEGIHDLHEGRLRQAMARFRIAVDSTHFAPHNHSHGNAWAGALYVAVLYEVNEIKEADHLLNVYLPFARDIGYADQLILTYVTRSRILFLNGEVDLAFQCIEELEFIGYERRLQRVVSAAKLERARQLLMQGNATRSRDELQGAHDPTVWDRERRQRFVVHDMDYWALARARWDIHFGDARAALPVLEAEIAAAARSFRRRRVLKLTLLKARALQKLGEVSAALSELNQVLQQCCHEGFVRLVFDEGPVIAPLIARYRQSIQEADAPALSDPILAAYVGLLLEALSPFLDMEPPADIPVLSEPLTAKEIRILELLAEGYSNGAMAEKLFISDSTVRTHLRNINTKMATKSRMQAVALARRMGAIS
jgi:LuxR family maltose regulon positive regulatory protein